jgi:hypothetical protein
MPNIYQARASVWVDSFLTPALIQSLQTVQSTEASKMSIIIPANSANINNLAISILSGLDFKRNIVKVLENKFGNLANIGLDNLDDKKIEKLIKSKIDPKTQSMIKKWLKLLLLLRWRSWTGS